MIHLDLALAGFFIAEISGDSDGWKLPQKRESAFAWSSMDS